MLQRAELFQPLRQLERRRLEPRPALQRRAPKGVEPEVLPPGSRRAPSRRRASAECVSGRSRARDPSRRTPPSPAPGSATSAGSSGAAAVPTSSPASTRAIAPASAARGRNGSSPWTLTMTSYDSKPCRGSRPRPHGRSRTHDRPCVNTTSTPSRSDHARHRLGVRSHHDRGSPSPSRSHALQPGRSEVRRPAAVEACWGVVLSRAAPE